MTASTCMQNKCGCGGCVVNEINTHQIDTERGQNVSRNFILKCENCYQQIS